MTLIRPSLDYTAKDFDSLRARLFNTIPSAFPEWSDQQVANFGNLLVELFAWVGDVLLYYQDNQAQESRWSSAKLRRSLLAMIKMLNYTPKGVYAAKATLTFQLAAPPLGSVTINVGDRFSTQDAGAPVTFQTRQAYVIAAGADPAVVFIEVENSISQLDEILSTGLPNQSYTLGVAPYIEESLVISAGNGAYTIVDDLLDSTATDRHATISVDENVRARITFGDGTSGAIPSGLISLAYRSGGGTVGNVGPGLISKPLGSYSDAFSNAVVARVVNVAKATGGTDVQTIESIREEAPRSLRTLTRTVSREDYETNALRVAGVQRALMLTKDELETVPENQGFLYLVPTGGGIATTALMNDVRDMITTKYPKTITFKPTVLPAKYIEVNVSTIVHLSRGAVGSVVGAAVRKAVTDFFAIQAADGSRNNAIDFGYYMDGSIAWSDVFNAVRDTKGVRKVDDGLANLTLNGEADDLAVPFDKFPTLVSVQVIDGTNGALL